MTPSIKSISRVGLLALSVAFSLPLAAESPVERLANEYPTKVVPVLQQHCAECHSPDLAEAEIDLSQFATFQDVAQHPEVWQKIAEMVSSGQMPPKDAKPLADTDRELLRQWVGTFLKEEAKRNAGDPGPSILRRLSNAEYTYSLRDLTGVDSLEPALEFPVDGAAGEGFTNAAQALVMSPSLFTKYLDAGKEVASHAVLLPRGIRFSPATTRRDWTNEAVARIREIYGKYATSEGATQVNLQGIVFDTNGGGRLPIERYFAALLEEREALESQGKSLSEVAAARKLSPRYLQSLWAILQSDHEANPSLLLAGLQKTWKSSAVDVEKLTAFVSPWQQALWKFSSVGHIGKVGGPKAWMEPVNPLSERQEIRQKLEVAPNAKEVTIYLVASDAGDGDEGDDVLWERPRLVAPGRQDLLLRDVRRVARQLEKSREFIFSSTAAALEAVAAVRQHPGPIDARQLAADHKVAPEALNAWLSYFGMGTSGPAKIGSLIADQTKSVSGYDFVQGWVGPDALSVVANASDQHVRIPGNMAPHAVAVHPAPSQSAVIGWRSPVATKLQIAGVVQHAHPECGNGVAWKLELCRGSSRQILAHGIAHGASEVTVGPVESVSVQPSDLVALVLNPRDGNHSCDLTRVDVTLKSDEGEWNLSRDVAADILAGNPHPDRNGNPEVWHFASEPAASTEGHVIPANSLVARWQSTDNVSEQKQLAEQIHQLLTADLASLSEGSPDRELYLQLSAPAGPLLASLLDEVTRAGVDQADVAEDSGVGLDAGLFGKHPDGRPVDAASLCVHAPSVLAVTLPADLAVGAELVTTATLHPRSATLGSVQCQVLTTPPATASGLTPAGTEESTAAGPWTSNNQRLSYSTPILVGANSAARQRIEKSFDDFRRWFPAALCYAKIVPVDEVITLTLFHREDEPLSRLMLSDEEAKLLDEHWEELRFVSQDALALVDAFEQLLQFASQDADPGVFAPMRQPIMDRAARFKEQLLSAEPHHVDAVLTVANRAYRRPLEPDETAELLGLYQTLRREEILHEDAIRLLLARVFISPAFLYRPEAAREAGVVTGDRQAGPNAASFTAHPISDLELATRLSYFLSSSIPDDELRAAAASNTLHREDVLLEQTRRLLRDKHMRRFATEFACQWMHVYQFDEHDEKSSEAFPAFTDLRGSMYEEPVQFFADLFVRNGSLLEVLDADHTFVNGALAAHYGLEKVDGDQWRRVDGLRAVGRGGVLGMAATLAKQSGASRTSPILRGNWVCEVLLGDKLPNPPKDVPVLPDTVPAGLTERQLIEQHSSVESCAKCHARIDPLGFSLEGFDAIGRWRERDPDAKLDLRGKLPDGSEIVGLSGLRNYLLTTRRHDFVRQFCKKLLGYALGRGVQLSDEPLLEEMMRNLAANEYRVSTAVETIVLSPQFRNIRTAQTPANALRPFPKHPLPSKQVSIADQITH